MKRNKTGLDVNLIKKLKNDMVVKAAKINWKMKLEEANKLRPITHEG